MENNKEKVENINTIENENNIQQNIVARAKNEIEEPVIQFPNAENEDSESIAENPQSANEVSANCIDLETRDVQNMNILGKFKSVEQLAKAYENLQAEFTRRSQLLKQLEQNKADNLDKKTYLELCASEQNNNTQTQIESEQNSEICPQNESEQSPAENVIISENADNNAKNTEKTQKNNEKSSNFDENQINSQLKEFVETGQISKETYLEIANKIMQNSKLLDDASGIAQAVLTILSEKKTDFETKIADPEFIVSLAQNNKQAYDTIISEYVDGCQRKNLPLFMTKNFGASIPASTPAVPTTLSEARVVLEKLLSD